MTPDSNDLWFLPLGGTGEIGMNLNLYGHDGRWLMVDCGVTFPKPGRLAADGSMHHHGEPPVQMADPAFIADRRETLCGLVITHAHEDHVGGADPFHTRSQRADDPHAGRQYFPQRRLEAGRPAADWPWLIPNRHSRIWRLRAELIAALIGQLQGMGVKVITAEQSDLPIHASGHPAQEELEAMYRWVQPAVAIPVHGEEEHMAVHARLAKQTGVPKTLVGRNGDLFMIRPVPGMRRQITETGRLGWFKEALVRVV
ncbi:MBL fold metallo-hydrolase RNA specificity domain-containing protein [Marinobacter gelidimuriae]|uniref:MBL fold metallo-hydrolase RNA specificity domain-containing protein n=1 Tax=Marinobacter gelidimuriae TaxID=2739064 RepID=UPI0003795D58|nr:MBL fold metallo-hydrolase RNA specificity domain-containing protein [Marinobacter gelidimuriae]